MKVSMTRDWLTPDGEVAEVAGYDAARAWILKEAKRRNRRLAGYERTIIDRGNAVHVVDFGDHSVFGLVQFGPESEMAEPVPPPAEKPVKAPERVVLGALPVSVSELELAIHSACDAGRWKWSVRLDGNNLVLEEPWK